MMKRFLCIAISAAVLLGVVAQQPAMTDIKKQKKEAQQDIKKTSQKIKENKNETAKTLADLNRITSEIDASNKKIADLNLQIADINVRIHGVNKEIEMLDSTVGRLQSNYLRAIKKIRMHRVSGNKMMFLLSSESFHQAYRACATSASFQDGERRRPDKSKRQGVNWNSRNTSLWLCRMNEAKPSTR